MEHSTTGFVGFGFRDNVNGLELTESERADFTKAVIHGVETIGGSVLFAGTGTGEWEGVIEPAGHVTFTLAIGADVTERKASLREYLAILAEHFDQECIALTFGDTVLVDAYHD